MQSYNSSSDKWLRPDADRIFYTLVLLNLCEIKPKKQPEFKCQPNPLFLWIKSNPTSQVVQLIMPNVVGVRRHVRRLFKKGQGDPHLVWLANGHTLWWNVQEQAEQKEQAEKEEAERADRQSSKEQAEHIACPWLLEEHRVHLDVCRASCQSPVTLAKALF
jgi:hypothetical protein